MSKKIQIGDWIPAGAVGSANPEHVLEGETFSSHAGIDLKGAMKNNGDLTKTITTQNGKQIITPGYYEGGEVKAQFSNLISSNIKKGVNVGGVVGSFQGERVKVITHRREITGYQGNITQKEKFDSWITPIGYVLVIDGKIWTYEEASHFSRSGYALGTGSINLSFADSGEIFSVTSSTSKENGNYVTTYNIVSENRGTCKYVAYWFCYY